MRTLSKRQSAYGAWDPVGSELEDIFHEGVYLSNPLTVGGCILKGVDPNLPDEDHLSALHHAAIRGDLGMAQVLLKANGLNINAVNLDGTTPLMYACRQGKLEFAKELVSHGANVNMKNVREQTALHLACIRNNTKLVQLLITNGAHINARDTFDNTPLSLAVIDRGAIPLATLLLRNGASATSVKQFPLFLGYLPAAQSLVRRSEDNLEGRDRSGRTPKEVAWDHRNMDVFRYFNDYMEHTSMIFVDVLQLIEDDELTEENEE